MVFERNPLFLNTILLGGTTEEKIIAARKAGFQQIELWHQDIKDANYNITRVKNILRHNQLLLTDYQVLLDFDGVAKPYRQAKYDEAITMLNVAAEIGADTLLVPANTDSSCIEENIEEDLTWLVEEADKRKIRIAYEAMAWSSFNYLTTKAWELVHRINAPNLGLVIDAFHIFSLNRTIQDLTGIPMDKIFLVQLSDAKALPEHKNIKAIARHHRLLPGEGVFPLHTLLNHLAQHQYEGPIGLEVFNDDLKSENPEIVANKAMKSLRQILKN